MVSDKYFEGISPAPLSADELLVRFGEYADIMGNHEVPPADKHQKEIEFEGLIQENPEAYQELMRRMSADFDPASELAGAVATREVFFHLGDTSGTQG